jgi:hypothetical protein
VAVSAALVKQLRDETGAWYDGLQESSGWRLVVTSRRPRVP